MHKIFGTRIENADYYHRPGAYVIPYRDGKIAVARTPKGDFLLGGGKEPAADCGGAAGDRTVLEDDLTCIRRECLEEVGMTVRVGSRICSAETFCQIPECGYFHPIQVYYEGDLLEKIQQPVEPDHQLVWVDPKEAADSLFVLQQRWAVERYMERLQGRQPHPDCDIVKLDPPDRAAHLFRGWQETLIWSCLQGVMGCVYGDRQETPASAAAVLGDFCFLAGRPSRTFLSHLSKRVRQDYLIMVPADGTWGDVIETQFKESAKKITRYATKKDTRFDRTKLQAMSRTVPEGMELKILDREIFDMARGLSWCRDWVVQFDSYEEFSEKGLGVVLMRGGEPVSGASSYSSYERGIEIEIDTREDCRRQGLARICAAALILQCLDRGLYPSWDAHNEASLALAKQLGYVFDHAYTAYEVDLSGRSGV